MPQNFMHNHLRSISRVNILLAVFALVGVGFLYVWFKWGLLPAAEVQSQQETTQDVAQKESQVLAEGAQEDSANVVDQAELVVAYQEAVNELFADYDAADAEASSAQLQELLALTVPVSLQDFHLDLAIVASQAQSGDVEKATQLFSLLQEEYDWFLTGQNDA